MSMSLKALNPVPFPAIMNLCFYLLMMVVPKSKLTSLISIRYVSPRNPLLLLGIQESMAGRIIPALDGKGELWGGVESDIGRHL